MAIKKIMLKMLLADIEEKFLHSSNLYYATLFGRYNAVNEIGQELKEQDQSKISILF